MAGDGCSNAAGAVAVEVCHSDCSIASCLNDCSYAASASEWFTERRSQYCMRHDRVLLHHANMTPYIRPGILSSIWGLPNLGRNFGVISYAPFFGTTFFSYVYAFVAAENTSPMETVCRGVKCWRSTFWFSTGITSLAACGSGVLWRRWKGRV